MQSPKSISRIKNGATRIYARYGFGKIEEVSEYSAAGISKDVYWFDSDSKNSGHCTPFNTLLMNKRPFRDLSQTAQDYVFLHETGHSKLTFPFNLLMYLLLIPTLLLALLSPFVAVQQVIVTWYATTSIYATFLAAIAGVIVVAICTSLFTLTSWLSEGHAELYALNRIGREPYLKTSKEIKEYADRNQIRRILHRIQYPPPSLVVWISKKI
jgi:hypothetical protein